MKGHVDEIQPKESNCVIKMEQQIWYKALFIERVKGKRGKPRHGWITKWACQAQALRESGFLHSICFGYSQPSKA